MIAPRATPKRRPPKLVAMGPEARDRFRRLVGEVMDGILRDHSADAARPRTVAPRRRKG